MTTRVPDQITQPRLDLDAVAPDLKEFPTLPRYVEITPKNAPGARLVHIRALAFSVASIGATPGDQTTNALLMWIAGNLAFALVLGAFRRRVFVREDLAQ